MAVLPRGQDRSEFVSKAFGVSRFATFHTKRTFPFAGRFPLKTGRKGVLMLRMYSAARFTYTTTSLAYNSGFNANVPQGKALGHDK